MKKYISFIGILGIAIFLSGCDYQVSVQEKDNNQEEQLNLEQTDKIKNINDAVVNNTKTEQPKTEVKVSIKDIKEAFIKKYPKRDYSNYTFTIRENRDNKYIEGAVSAPEGGGAHYWAAKVDQNWIIITEAQDSVSCSIFEPYNFPNDMIKCVKTEEENIGMYTGLIKKYSEELIAGDISHYIELSDGIKKSIKICDKRVMKLDNQINLLAGNETEVTIYSDRVERSTLCVNGMVLELGDINNKYTGVIKELPLVSQGYAYYIELSDGIQKQIQICDKRITGIWDTVIGSMISSSEVDLYSNSPSQSGICVSGVVINNL